MCKMHLVPLRIRMPNSNGAPSALLCANVRNWLSMHCCILHVVPNQSCVLATRTTMIATIQMDSPPKPCVKAFE